MKPLWLLSFSIAAFPLLACAKQACKCLSSQPCWPSSSDFSALSSQLSQPLFRPTPPASACYPPSNPFGNCTDAISHLADSSFRSNIPGAMQSINFESFTFDNGTIDACYYNFTLGFPCDQGNVPILGVDARTIGDVQATIKFAAKHYLRLVVKNTGHDYLGRSIGRGAFMLWTHNLNNISYDDVFIPSGAPSGSQKYKALTVGAGVQWNEAYVAANDHGRLIVGGLYGTVGAAGGWVQGGGHSALSPSYGLGVDNAVQFTLVLACGKYITVNAYQNQDIFWALRGGGGGTYGVVISVTYQTHDVLPSTAIFFLLNFTSPATAQNVTTEYFSMLSALSDAGWGGYAFFFKRALISVKFASDCSIAQGNATFSTFIDRALATIGNPELVAVQIQPFSSFYQAFQIYFSKTGQVGTTTEMVSRLLSRSVAQEQPEKAAKAVLGITEGFQINFVAGGAVSKVNPDSTGLNPAWRKSLGLVRGISWDEGTATAEINRLRQGAAADLKILDTVSADSGSYLNEGSLHEKDFKKTFFGSHYARLKDIKRKYDEDDLLLVAEGVGSDDWDRSLNCRRDWNTHLSRNKD